MSTGGYLDLRTGEVCDEGLTDRWNVFRTDRQLGRAREFRAGESIRVG